MEITATQRRCPAHGLPGGMALAGGPTQIPGGLRAMLLRGAGILATVAGVIGIVVPVWPTTCFLLLATACFARSSPRLHDWLLGNRWFGAALRRYRDGGGVTRRVKAGSLAASWTSLGVSAAWLGLHPVSALLGLIGLAITAHITRLPTAEAGS